MPSHDVYRQCFAAARRAHRSRLGDLLPAGGREGGAQGSAEGVWQQVVVGFSAQRARSRGVVAAQGPAQIAGAKVRCGGAACKVAVEVNAQGGSCSCARAVRPGVRSNERAGVLQQRSARSRCAQQPCAASEAAAAAGRRHGLLAARCRTMQRSCERCRAPLRLLAARGACCNAAVGGRRGPLATGLATRRATRPRSKPCLPGAPQVRDTTVGGR